MLDMGKDLRYTIVRFEETNKRKGADMSCCAKCGKIGETRVLDGMYWCRECLLVQIKK